MGPLDSAFRLRDSVFACVVELACVIPCRTDTNHTVISSSVDRPSVDTGAVYASGLPLMEIPTCAAPAPEIDEEDILCCNNNEGKKSNKGGRPSLTFLEYSAVIGLNGTTLTLIG